MKRIATIIALAAALMISSGLSAQDRQGKPQGPRPGRNAEWQDKVKAEKIAFLTTEMELTPEEAQIFWPVYNQAEKEKWNALKTTREAFKALSDAMNEEKGEKEISECLKKYLKASKSSGEIDAEYMDEYLKILPAKKVAKLYLGEEKFRKVQFQHMQGQRMDQGPKGPRPDGFNGHHGPSQGQGQGLGRMSDQDKDFEEKF